MLLRAFVSISLLIPFLAVGCGGAEPEDATTDETTEDLTTSNGRTAFNFFVAKGLTQTEAAAIVGNLQQESGINPASVQPGGPGRGIAQWSVGDRWNDSSADSLSSYAHQHGLATSSLTAQLDFIWYELQTYSKYGLSRLKSAKTLTSAVLAFQTDFEICGTCEQSKRVSYAQAALHAYGH